MKRLKTRLLDPRNDPEHLQITFNPPDSPYKSKQSGETSRKQEHYLAFSTRLYLNVSYMENSWGAFSCHGMRFRSAPPPYCSASINIFFGLISVEKLAFTISLGIYMYFLLVKLFIPELWKNNDPIEIYRSL